MRRLLTALLAALLLALLAPGAPRAQALSCVNPADRLDKMDLVVHAKVMRISKPHWAEVLVERYYRGAGPDRLLVEYRGLKSEPDYAWAQAPVVGQDALLELGKDQQGYFLAPCALNMAYNPASPEVQKLLSTLGAGQAPTAGAAVGAEWSPGRLLIIGSGILLIVGAGAIWLVLRRR
jgi:hypothetical protein